MLQFVPLRALKGYPKLAGFLTIPQKCYLCYAIRQIKFNKGFSRINLKPPGNEAKAKKQKQIPAPALKQRGNGFAY